MMTNQPLITDFEQTVIDNQCGQRRWWAYHESGEGLSSIRTMVRDRIIAETHNDLVSAADMQDLDTGTLRKAIADLQANVDKLPEDEKTPQLMELFYRRLGLLFSYMYYVEPSTRDLFDTLPLPKEMMYRKGPLYVQIWPGRLLRNKISGKYLYRQYVPMPNGWNRQHWMRQWFWNPQLHLESAAIEEEMQIEIEFAQVVGINMGLYSSTDNSLIHPYVRAWKKRGSNLWYSYRTLQEKDQPVDPMPVWHYPYGIASWVLSCGRDQADSMFQLTHVVRPSRKILSKWVQYRMNREREIATYEGECTNDEHARAVHFPRMSENCRPDHGEECPYMAACWAPGLANDPLKGNEYIPNVALNNPERMKAGRFLPMLRTA